MTRLMQGKQYQMNIVNDFIFVSDDCIKKDCNILCEVYQNNVMLTQETLWNPNLKVGLQ